MLIGVRLADGDLSPSQLIILAFLYGPCLEGASESINDFFDRKTDNLKYVRHLGVIQLSGGTGLIQRRIFSPMKVFFISVTMYTIALLASLAFESILFTALVFAYILLGVLYSAPPVRLKEMGFGGPFSVGIAFGGLALWGGYAAAANSLPPQTILCSVPLVLIITGAFMTHQIADFQADQKAGVKTFCVRHGPRNTTLFSGSLIAAGFFLLAIQPPGIPISYLWAGFVAALALIVVVGLTKQHMSQLTRTAAIGLQMLVSIVYIVG